MDDGWMVEIDDHEDPHTKLCKSYNNKKYELRKTFMIHNNHDCLPFAKMPTILPTYEITKYNKYIMMNG
jgi:hypothetical protein